MNIGILLIQSQNDCIRKKCLNDFSGALYSYQVLMNFHSHGLITGYFCEKCGTVPRKLQLALKVNATIFEPIKTISIC